MLDRLARPAALTVLAISAPILLGVLVWQLKSPVPDGPTLGRQFPNILVSTLDEQEAPLQDVLPSDGCTLLVVISTQCGVCAAMRSTWATRFQVWADSLRSPVRPVWLVVEGAESWATFAEGFSLPVAPVFPTDPPEDTYRTLRVRGTPTFHVVDDRGVLAFTKVGDFLPPVADTRSACDP